MSKNTYKKYHVERQSLPSLAKHELSLAESEGIFLPWHTRSKPKYVPLVDRNFSKKTSEQQKIEERKRQYRQRVLRYSLSYDVLQSGSNNVEPVSLLARKNYLHQESVAEIDTISFSDTLPSTAEASRADISRRNSVESQTKQLEDPEACNQDTKLEYDANCMSFTIAPKDEISQKKLINIASNNLAPLDSNRSLSKIGTSLQKKDETIAATEHQLSEIVKVNSHSVLIIIDSLVCDLSHAL